MGLQLIASQTTAPESATEKQNWLRVSRESPCPICGKPDNCCISRDGTVVWCGRIRRGALRENAGGQFLFRLTPGVRVDRLTVLQPVCARPPPGPYPADWQVLADDLARNAGAWIAELAVQLGVSADSLRALGVGYETAARFWSFPERDGTGRVIGIHRRFRDGAKRRMRGSRAGLTYSDGWADSAGTVLLVEGATDVAACLTMGIPAIGRPSNTGGVRLLADLLKGVPANRQVIVMGERDQKVDGSWPGRLGAIQTAKGLAQALGREIGWSLPPEGVKDVREWLQSQLISATGTAVDS